MESQRPVWFEDHGTSEAQSRVLPPPQKLLRDHQNFKKSLRTALRIKQNDVHIASTKEELERQIQDTQTEIDPRLVAQQKIDDATKIYDGYSADRTHGGRRVGRWAQDFVHGFAQFVSAYSGIIDAVTTASGPYGEVAYQTLSILLIVVVNKSSNDTRIKELMDDLRKSFPRLEDWKVIYPTQTMRGLVAAAYGQVISFSQLASEYFSRFFKRFAMAFISPPLIGVEKVAALIHRTLAEINSEAMYGLHGRSQRIETQVVRSGQTIEQLEAQITRSNDQLNELQAQNKKLESKNDQLFILLKDNMENFEAYKKKVEERVLQEDKQHLEALQEDLGVTVPAPETNINDTKECLMKVFPNMPHYIQHLPATSHLQMSRSLLQSTETYQKWTASTKSCMLCLIGKTTSEGRHYKQWTHSWLSPAATYVTEDLVYENLPVTFFSCHPGMESKSIPTKKVISSLILQILKKNPQVLRDHAVQFHSSIHKESIQDSKREKKQVKAMVDLLGDVLAAVKQFGTTYVVLDRLDRCEGKFSFLMDELVRLVGNPACNVKFVIVADTSLGGGEWHPEYLLEDECKPDQVFVNQDWNQRKMTDIELSKGERHLTWTVGSSTGTLGNRAA